jgi:hypothetical protein
MCVQPRFVGYEQVICVWSYSAAVLLIANSIQMWMYEG